MALASGDSPSLTNSGNANGRRATLTVDLKLRPLLALSGASNGGALAEAAERGASSSAILIKLTDGRVLSSHSRQRTGGGVVITLFEVTRFIQEAELAARDPLTGLANRSALTKSLKDYLDASVRNKTSVAVLCIDLDRFKGVNDTLGHAVGDALLTKVAERLRSVLRDSDLVARVGGDEFIIVQDGNVEQPQAGEAMARRLVDLVGRAYVVNGHLVNVGASVGIAVSPTDGEDGATLLQHADLALYRAKMDGRGQFRFFQSEMDAVMQRRRALETALRGALALKELELVYQPQVDLKTNAVTGFEALLRWHSSERGNVSPGEFIPLAEELGLIVPIGEWVLRTACYEAAKWTKSLTIAVNISAVQFRSGKLIGAVQEALAASGIDPARLELEITEGALLENTESVLKQLNALKRLGISISMDDFGTGYSSLSYLQKFPFDKIKIDQSFVRSEGSQGGRAIVRAVAALGSSFGIRTIAEGVETPEQLEQVCADGCMAVQGFLTGRPLAASAAASLAER